MEDMTAPSQGSAPLVSILTPSLNQARYLVQCVTSVALQTYGHIEHIICDGGSTDGTVDYLASCATPHVRWVSEPDEGQADAVNKAFRASRGSIIGWLNSDDAFADRRAVHAAVELFLRDKRIGFVFGGALLVNEDNIVLQAFPPGPFSLRTLQAVHHPIQPSFFFRRSALRDPLLRDDLEFVFDRALMLDLAHRERHASLPLFVAVDRHQRERKVETGAWHDEQLALDQQLRFLPRRTDRLLSLVLRTRRRFAGAIALLTLPRRIQPALPLAFPELFMRLRLQLMTRRPGMPFASER